MTNHLIDPTQSGPDVEPPVFVSDDDLQTERGRYQCEVWRTADGHQYAIVRQGQNESLVNAREIIDRAIQRIWPGSIIIEYWPKGKVPEAPLFAMPYPQVVDTAQLRDRGLPVTPSLP